MFFSETLGDISLMPFFFQQGFQHTNSMSSLLNICFQDCALEAKVRLKDSCSSQKKKTKTQKKPPQEKNTNSEKPQPKSPIAHSIYPTDLFVEEIEQTV